MNQIIRRTAILLVAGASKGQQDKDFLNIFRHTHDHKRFRLKGSGMVWGYLHVALALYYISACSVKR